jgi:general secretion pathway protein F
MKRFYYRAVDQAGKALTGHVQAGDNHAALQALQGQGLVVLELSDDASTRAQPLRFWSLPIGMPLLVQQQVFEQLATLLRAGLPLDRALGIVAELPESSQLKVLLSDVRQAVRGGKSLSVAMANATPAFSEVALNLVRAGELAGTLPQNLAQAGLFLAQGERLRGKLLNALIYPALLLVTVFLAVIFLMVVVVPQFAVLFENLNTVLPWYTTWLLAISSAIRSYGLIIAAALALAAAGLLFAARQPHLRQVWDAKILRWPVIGPLWQKAEVARFSASLSVMLAQGVPMLSALTYSGALMQNRHLRQQLATACEAVKAGKGLAHALAQGFGFPHMALQMMQAGEDSGQLPSMLAEVAGAYEQQTEQVATRLLAVLVPALTLLMTAIVAIVILAVLLPVYDLTGGLDSA